jgi:RNA polymerase sigma-70 factor (sigma-E family)
MPDRQAADADFVDYARASASRLRDLAFLMCRDWHLAQDLTQTTLTKLYVAWPKVSRADDIEAYARTVLVRSFLDHRRRKSSGEVVKETLPEAGDEHSADLRLTLLDALGRLEPRDRAIVVLRYWEDYSVERVAQLLRVREGVVKTQSMRSLARLRELLAGERIDLFG